MDTSDIRSHRLTTVQSEGHSQTHVPQATPVHRWSNDDRMPGLYQKDRDATQTQTERVIRETMVYIKQTATQERRVGFDTKEG